MSVSKWSYDPDKCDGDYCPGDCDFCHKANEEEVTVEEIVRSASWNTGDNMKIAVVKDIVKNQIDDFSCGIFFTRNYAGDLMETIYDDGEVQIDVCRGWEYFEIFGLNNDEKKEVKEYYEELRGRRKECEMKREDL